MNNVISVNVYKGLEDTDNTLSGDTIGVMLRIPTKVSKASQTNQSPIKREGTKMITKQKKIETIYSQIFLVLAAAILFGVFNLITKSVLNRFGSVLLLVLSVSGLIAFIDDYNRWRKHSAK